MCVLIVKRIILVNSVFFASDFLFQFFYFSFNQRTWCSLFAFFLPVGKLLLLFFGIETMPRDHSSNQLEINTWWIEFDLIWGQNYSQLIFRIEMWNSIESSSPSDKNENETKHLQNVPYESVVFSDVTLSINWLAAISSSNEMQFMLIHVCRVWEYCRDSGCKYKSIS